MMVRRSGPVVELTRAAWTGTVLASPLAHDPLVGREVLRTIQLYLDLRRRAVVKPASRYSQDEFGLFDDDMDWDDPQLNDLVTGGNKVDVVARPADPTRERDATFAQLVKASVLPALYRILSNMHAPDYCKDRAAPAITDDDEAYVADLIEAWATCAAVLVKHDLAVRRPS